MHEPLSGASTSQIIGAANLCNPGDRIKSGGSKNFKNFWPSRNYFVVKIYETLRDSKYKFTWDFPGIFKILIRGLANKNGGA